jgi:hypothetical protein
MKILSALAYILVLPFVIILAGVCIAEVFIILIPGGCSLALGGNNRRYVMNILIGIDQLGNTLMFGDPDETISSRAGRRWPNSAWSKFINTLFFWQKQHVSNAIEEDEAAEDDLI